jgi:hypothetical protein
MPKPRKNESRSKYVSRAIPQIMAEGLTQKQAAGKAEGLFDFYKSKKKGSKHG